MTLATADPAATLAAIIREVDDSQCLMPHALACAILAHPDSQWGPVLPVPTDVELEADFRAWFNARYDSNYFGGINLADAIAWGKHLLQQSPQPAAPWPELPPQPPGPPSRTVNWRDLCAELLKGLDENRHEQVRYPGHLRIIMDQARTALQCQSEQAGVAPTPAPAFPEISDQLIKMLIGDVLAVTGTTTEQSCLDRCWNPVPELRSRLTEILRLAAQDEAKRPAS